MLHPTCLIVVFCVAGLNTDQIPQKPDNTHVLYVQASKHLGENNYLDALAALQAIVTKTPLHAAAQHDLAAIYQTLGRTDKSQAHREEYRAAVKRLISLEEEPSSLDRFFLQDEIERFLREWKDAWERRELDKFLSFYSEDFTSDNGAGKQQWYEKKKKFFAKAAWIEVTISELETRRLENGLSVSFKQGYKSDTYSDRGLKNILLGWEGDGWTIRQETWAPLK